MSSFLNVILISAVLAVGQQEDLSSKRRTRRERGNADELTTDVSLMALNLAETTPTATVQDVGITTHMSNHDDLQPAASSVDMMANEVFAVELLDQDEVATKTPQSTDVFLAALSVAPVQDVGITTHMSNHDDLQPTASSVDMMANEVFAVELLDQDEVATKTPQSTDVFLAALSVAPNLAETTSADPSLVVDSMRSTEPVSELLVVDVLPDLSGQRTIPSDETVIIPVGVDGFGSGGSMVNTTRPSIFVFGQTTNASDVKSADDGEWEDAFNVRGSSPSSAHSMVCSLMIMIIASVLL